MREVIRYIPGDWLPPVPGCLLRSCVAFFVCRHRAYIEQGACRCRAKLDLFPPCAWLVWVVDAFTAFCIYSRPKPRLFHQPVNDPLTVGINITHATSLPGRLPIREGFFFARFSWFLRGWGRDITSRYTLARVS